jgi:hypothetical protein
MDLEQIRTYQLCVFRSPFGGGAWTLFEYRHVALDVVPSQFLA